ncbi:MAG: class I SAM-dependent methyltransferase [Alphaproteobacteria bacterium]|nr:class I SAM-dependent methyltransferase [Alphaproteobacteria bacterium]
MSDFPAYLRALIGVAGPQPIARVMAEALGHPEHGYYMNRDPFGAAGDFITAPEISQMFGELIGLWCVATYEQIGAQPQIHLIEFGPGRGTLMADALRATKQFSKFRAALDLHLVETSPTLREAQRTTLGDQQITWHDRLDDVPNGPALLIANEFFDALPIEQLIATETGWRERCVALCADGASFRFVEASATPPVLPAWLPAADQVPTGTIAEYSPAREAAAAMIGARLARFGGAALLIDYGHAKSAPGDTLQAVRAHRTVPVLETLGEADLTAHVDFAGLARAAQTHGATSWGPITQGRLLTTLGIEARAARLSAQATPDQASAIDAALHRLTASHAMGTLFKALALTPANAPAPAGFESVGTTDTPMKAELVHG